MSLTGAKLRITADLSFANVTVIAIVVVNQAFVFISSRLHPGPQTFVYHETVTYACPSISYASSGGFQAQFKFLASNYNKRRSINLA